MEQFSRVQGRLAEGAAKDGEEVRGEQNGREYAPFLLEGEVDWGARRMREAAI